MRRHTAEEVQVDSSDPKRTGGDWDAHNSRRTVRRGTIQTVCGCPVSGAGTDQLRSAFMALMLNETTGLVALSWKRFRPDIPGVVW